MRKNRKQKSNKADRYGQSNIPSQMMTQQQQRMYYINRKRNDQQTSQNQKIRKGFKTSTSVKMNPDIQEDHQDIGPTQFNNLNQTSAQEITQFINKLILKNKVTSKNAFDIPLIHLQQMEDYRASLNQNTWKRLSSTLQNDYKIYGYRVDATHNITYKMVESIARHQTSIEENLGINKRQNNRSQKDGQMKKQTNSELLMSFMDSTTNSNISKNKLNVQYTKFIEKNQKLLNVTHIETFFSCNPGLQRTKRKFDQQGLKGLLLNNIALNDGCQLKLDENRKPTLSTKNEAKKEPQQSEAQRQDKLMFQSQADQLFKIIFAQNNKNESNLTTQQDKQNIFTTIHELNINQGQAKDQFAKYQRLYRIVSGQDKEQKKNSLKNRIKQQTYQIRATQTVNQDTQQPIHTEVHRPDQNAQQTISPDNQQHFNQGSRIVQERQENGQILQLEINDGKQVNPQNQKPKELGGQRDGKIVQQHGEQQGYKDQEYKKTKGEDESHPLLDRNFQMQEVNLENTGESSPSIADETREFRGKFKNIQEYIKMKQPKRKIQRKRNVKLNSDQIGKKLFNRKYKKSRNDSSSNKDSASLKQQDSNNGQSRKNRVCFQKITSQSLSLKRSHIFKKSILQQRTFNQIKAKIRQTLQDRQKISNLDEETDLNKIKKGKKASKIFDLPVFQFEKDDINYTEPYEQIDPQTNQLEFSSLYTQNFPSFVFSSHQIQQKIKSKRDKKKNQIQESKRFTELSTQLKMAKYDQLTHQQNIEAENNQSHEINPQQPDISFIYDQMGQFRGGNQQIAIRQAKQKMKKIMLKMFSMKKHRIHHRKHKRNNTISFKQIYQAYYRQEGFISPALAFLTVLHLANEHNLVLQGKEDGTDFKIYVEEQNKMGDNMLIYTAEQIQQQKQIAAEMIAEEGNQVQKEDGESKPEQLQGQRLKQSVSKNNTLSVIVESIDCPLAKNLLVFTNNKTIKHD